MHSCAWTISGPLLLWFMNTEITSASHRVQRVGDVPAAMYVISRDEIRLSGLISLPVWHI